MLRYLCDNEELPNEVCGGSGDGCTVSVSSNKVWVSACSGGAEMHTEEATCGFRR